MKERKFFTVAQLVEYFGNGVISRCSVYAMIKKGDIPTVRIGERILIPASWVEQFVTNADNIVNTKMKESKA